MLPASAGTDRAAWSHPNLRLESNMVTLVENELAGALAQIAAQFKIRAEAERDFRAGSFYVALETLRLRWEANAWAGEAIEAGMGDRR